MNDCDQANCKFVLIHSDLERLPVRIWVLFSRYYFRSTESGIIVMYCLLIHNSYFSLSLHYERIFYPPKFSNDNLHSSDLSVSDADKCGLR